MLEDSPTVGEYLRIAYSLGGEEFPDNFKYFSTSVVYSTPGLVELTRRKFEPAKITWRNFFRSLSFRAGHVLANLEISSLLENSQEWSYLYVTAGDTVMRHLLFECVILQYLDSKRLLQVTGECLLFPGQPKSVVENVSWKPLLRRLYFSSRHPLGKQNPLAAGLSSKSIFPNFSENVLTRIQPHMNDLVRNALSFNYTENLERYCPSKATMDILSALSADDCFREVKVLGHLEVPQDRAIYAVGNILDDILTDHLFASKTNKAAFIRNTGMFMKTGVHECMPIAALRAGMKTSNFADRFDVEPGSSAAFADALTSFIWKFLVVPIIRFCFVVTDADSGSVGMRPVFFRKNVWSLLTRKAEIAYIKFLDLKKAPTVRDPDCDLRWLPKGKGVRPIVRQSKALKWKSRKLLSAMHAIRHTNPNVMGYSILMRDEGSGILKEKLCGTSSEEHFVFTADIKNCYESISHKSLYESIDQLESQSALFAFASFTCYASCKAGWASPRYKCIAYREGDISACFDQFKSGTSMMLIVPSDRPNKYKPQSWAEISSHIKHVISNWTFKLSSGVFNISNKGLIQGSSLASLLVSVHYGRIDRAMPGKDKAVILRLIDDFICITSDEAVAREIAYRVITQEAYGKISVQKCTGNFGGFAMPIRWTGFTLKPSGKNLNFAAEVWSVPMHEQTCVRLGDSDATTDSSIFKSIAMSQRQRLIPLLFEASLSTTEARLKNAYQAGAFIANRLKTVARKYYHFTKKEFDITNVMKRLEGTKSFKSLDSDMRKSYISGLRKTSRVLGNKFSK